MHLVRRAVAVVQRVDLLQVNGGTLRRYASQTRPPIGRFALMSNST